MINPVKIAVFGTAIVLLFLLTECRQKEQIPLCGHVEGTPIDTSFDGGLDNNDRTLASTNCLKIKALYDKSDRQTKWFSSSPSIAVMNALGYLKQDDADNSGDSYAMTFNVQEEFVFGPSRGEYAQFRQDGKGVILPGTEAAKGNEAKVGVNGQFDRWCQKLASIEFAGKDNWRRPTEQELNTLYGDGESRAAYQRAQWSSTIPSWSSTVYETEFEVGIISVAPSGYSFRSYANSAKFAVCVAAF